MDIFRCRLDKNVGVVRGSGQQPTFLKFVDVFTKNAFSIVFRFSHQGSRIGLVKGAVSASSLKSNTSTKNRDS